MKIKFLTAILSLFILTGCSLSDDNTTTINDVKFVWSLTQVTGGIAGVDNQFDLSTIIWEFDEVNGELLVYNNNLDDMIEDGLSTGTYLFDVIESNRDNFLVINNNEFGLFTINGNNLTINQNELSTGSGSDGFIYYFQGINVADN